MFIPLTLVWGFMLFQSCQQATPLEKGQKSWTIEGFTKIDSVNPILSPNTEVVFNCPLNKKQVYWAQRNVLNPTVVVKDSAIHLFFRAQDSLGTSRIGMATSTDGIHFDWHPEPVFYPDDDQMKPYEWNFRKVDGKPLDKECSFCYFDGVEDPRIVESEDGLYIMTYTAYDGKTARLALASSSDLLNWTKHGLVLKEEKYENTWSKAGAIVAKEIQGRMVATKIQDQYWMYFGDTNLFMATSEDLIHWKVAENEENNKRISVLHPRMGYFDSRLVEPGPAALLRDEGILLIYNGSNAANYNDPGLPQFTYAAGQALFDSQNPFRLIDRAESYFIHPNKDYEREGEVNEVCFVEGLVPFNQHWWLYYGTADSKIAVAKAPFH